MEYFFAGVYSFAGLTLGAVVLAWGVVARRWGRGGGGGVLILWVGPVFLLATLVGYTEAPGHVFTYLPGLILAVAMLATTVRFRVAMVAGLVLVNVVVFWLWPPGWDGVLWGTLRTRRELAEHDRQLRECVRAIEERYPAQSTVLCHVDRKSTRLNSSHRT